MKEEPKSLWCVGGRARMSEETVQVAAFRSHSHTHFSLSHTHTYSLPLSLTHLLLQCSNTAAILSLLSRCTRVNSRQEAHAWNRVALRMRAMTLPARRGRGEKRRG